jgi:hypothetical protein
VAEYPYRRGLLKIKKIYKKIKDKNYFEPKLKRLVGDSKDTLLQILEVCIYGYKFAAIAAFCHTCVWLTYLCRLIPADDMRCVSLYVDKCLLLTTLPVTPQVLTGMLFCLVIITTLFQLDIDRIVVEFVKSLYECFHNVPGVSMSFPNLESQQWWTQQIKFLGPVR